MGFESLRIFSYENTLEVPLNPKPLNPKLYIVVSVRFSIIPIQPLYHPNITPMGTYPHYETLKPKTLPAGCDGKETLICQLRQKNRILKCSSWDSRV